MAAQVRTDKNLLLTPEYKVEQSQNDLSALGDTLYCEFCHNVDWKRAHVQTLLVV